MRGIELAGFVMTVEEWQSLDSLARAEIVAAVMQWDAPNRSENAIANFAATSESGE